MTSAAARILAEGEAHSTDLPMDPWAYGVAAFAALVVLLLITLSFGKDR
jgi:hypothetical protein